ncbi:MAG: ComF family protein [Prevotella sp.]|nr:ComF family protein [Prevotella sp.]
MKTTSTRRVSFWSRVFDLIAPRACVACGQRLAESEETLCASCNLHLPRTGFAADTYENEMARCFWGRIPIERAAALFFYQPQSEASHAIYDLKYHHHPDYACQLGRFATQEFARHGFFEDIDCIVPIPLTRSRQLHRGYNQAGEIARGVAEATGLPIYNKVVRRNTFNESQTRKNRWERMESVEEAFELLNPGRIHGRHVLIVDDVVTTGATVCACAKELAKAGEVRVSVMSLGFTRT